MASIRELAISVVLYICIVHCIGNPLVQSRREIPEEKPLTSDPGSIDESRSWDEADGFDLDESPWLKQPSLSPTGGPMKIADMDDNEPNFIGDLDDDEEADDDDEDDDDIENAAGNSNPVLLPAEGLTNKGSTEEEKSKDNSLFSNSGSMDNNYLIPSEDMTQKGKREDIIGRNTLIDDGSNIRPADFDEDERMSDDDDDDDDDDEEDDADLVPYPDVDDDESDDGEDNEMFDSPSEDSKRLLDDNVFLF